MCENKNIYIMFLNFIHSLYDENMSVESGWKYSNIFNPDKNTD